MPPILALLLLLLAALAPALHAVESDSDPVASADPDYVGGKKAIESREWNAAIGLFSAAALRSPDNADIQNYLGFAHRNAGRLDVALGHYQRALKLDPRHRGAHEYIGEAYLMAKDLGKAEEHLAALDRLCLLPCSEYSDLKARIAAYKKR
ncbi:MAG TPA: tetratricopeptide repeat protein [Methylomirabilota bacterium]|nr:tetratricopeptide repeat protein [Methylomirabilota bacterium]